MKRLFLCLLIFQITKTYSQCENLKITQCGVDSLRIGMWKWDVEKLIGTKLEPDTLYNLMPESKKFVSSYRKDEKFNVWYKCSYKDVDFDLCFSPSSTLSTILPLGNSKIVETTSGIKVGVDINTFVKICKEYNYNYSFYTTNDKALFRDCENFDERILVKFTNSIITAICAETIAWNVRGCPCINR